MRISKSRYVAGLQCHKLLWLKVREPDAPELVPDAGIAARFDIGREVGERARACFDNGVLIDLKPRDPMPAVEATRVALAAGAKVIFEAAFATDDGFAAIDVLERIGDGFTLIEVKATLDPKPKHLPDLAMQVHMARRAGLRIDRVEVMHLNRHHRWPDARPLFKRADVTQGVNALVPQVADDIASQLRALSGECPQVAIGPHCNRPYECPFKARCWPTRATHDVGELYGASRKAEGWRESGYDTIDQLPSDVALKGVASRQRRAIADNKLIVEGDLAATLAKLHTPVAFLDFETIGTAIPVWPRCAPYQGVPVQHSVHRLRDDGVVEHDAFLAEPVTDPREPLARHLLAATQGARTVLAWNASFESQRIIELAKALPQLSRPLRDLAGRMHDLLPIVRNHVYHPDFRGRFSLKAVGPALVPDLGYTGLSIADGATASVTLETYLLHPERLSPQERTDLRTALLAYCERDTLLLVKIFELLRRLAREPHAASAHSTFAAARS